MSLNMKPSTAPPKFKVGDRVVVHDWQTWGDGRCDYELTITSVHSLSCEGGGKLHRYYGDTKRGPRGVYEDQIDRLGEGEEKK